MPDYARVTVEASFDGGRSCSVTKEQTLASGASISHALYYLAAEAAAEAWDELSRPAISEDRAWEVIESELHRVRASARDGDYKHELKAALALVDRKRKEAKG